jgi:nucleoside 2-deoxyribosyltransferase
MKRVYIAGAYSANNVIDVLKNIGRGEHLAAKLFFAGYAPFCPWHDKDYIIKRPDAIVCVDAFYEYSLAWLEVSDCILLVPGWEKSKGTLAEIEFANKRGIPVFETFEHMRGVFA